MTPVATKRDTSKQKRARQNRAQREALKARTEAAQVAPEERRTRASATPAAAPKGKAARAAERSARTRPVRPGDVPVDVATLEGNPLAKRLHVPGGRQVLFAFAITVVTSLTLAFSSYPPEGAEDGPRTESFFDAAGGAAWPLLLLPPLVVGIALALSLHPKRRRVWVVTAVAFGALTVAALAVYTVNLLALGFLVYAIQRAAKIEGPAPGSRAEKLAEQRRATAEASEGGDGDGPAGAADPDA